MMTLAAITFLLPCALAAYELGTVFPGEGGIYIWAHKAFGPVHGFIAGWLSWVPIFQLLPLGATTIVAHVQLAMRVELSLANQVILQIAVIWAVVAISLKKLEVSQRFVRWMFFVSLSTAFCALLAGLLAPAGRGTPLSRDIFSLDLSKYGALYSAAILWLLGVEVPFNMGAEFSDHKKTAGRMLLWGSLTLLVGYYVGIAGILMSTRADAVDGTTGVAKAATRARSVRRSRCRSRSRRRGPSARSTRSRSAPGRPAGPRPGPRRAGRAPGSGAGALPGCVPSPRSGWPRRSV